ncbi:MAG: glycosyltransferase family 1 protein, partial [Sphingobacteriaceae bacterium]
MDQPYKIFTWPVHQQYLFALAQGNFEFYVPADQNASFKAQFSAQKNVIEVDPIDLKNLDFDLILFQDEESYQTKQFEVLTEQQRQLPKIYLEHHPPKQHPTNAKNFVEDVAIQLVHVNHYNALMWDNNDLEVAIIENGVPNSSVIFSGEKAAGIMVLEEFPADDRVTGMDIFRQVKEALPITIIQIGKDGITYQNLPEKLKSYRFLFCTDRYQSPQFSVFQAMMIGMPVVGLGTTALPTIIENEVSGFVHSDLNYLIGRMKTLLNNPQLAVQLGENARKTAIQS